MKIKRVEDILLVEIPLKQGTSDYGSESLSETDNLYGVISGQEYTLSQLVDLSYKGDQQEGGPILHLDSEKELREICKDCDIQIIEHAICSRCNRPIYGCYTSDKSGDICSDCSFKEDEKEDTKNEFNKIIGMMKQWLNEDRITDDKKMVSSKELMFWFKNIINKI